MKKSFFLLGVAMLTVLTAGMALAENNLAEKKVVVISGISPEKADETGYTPVLEGIKKVFESKGIAPRYEWIDLTTGSDAEKKTAANEMASKVMAMKPDLVIVLSDDCLHQVGLKFKKIPVVFGMVFGDPTKLPGMPRENITGVVRKSYAGDIFALARRLLGVSSIAMIGTYSETLAGVKSYMAAGADKLEAATGVKYLGMDLVKTFEEWAKVINSTPAGCIYLTDTSRIIKGDKELPRAEITRWTVDNAKVPVVAATEADVAAGGLFAIVTSFTAQGEMAAQLAVKTLSGTAPSDIPYATSTKGRLVINAATAKKMKVNIPYEVLSTAEKIYE